MVRPAAVVLVTLALAACGDDGPDGAATTPPPPPPAASTAPPTASTAAPVPDELAGVVRAWSAAINANDNAAAAALFAPGAIVVQSQAYRLNTAEAARIWNDGLPCAGSVEALRMVGEAVVATFVLGERPGHRCDAPGVRAAAAFVVEDGRIRLWEQVPVPDAEPAAPAGTVA